MNMEKLRKTFTCLILFSTMLGIAPILVSCQQSANKQKQATDGVSQTSQPDTNRSGQNGTSAPSALNQEPQKPSGTTPEKKLDHPVVLGRDFKNDPNNQNSKMLNAFAKNSVENLGPTAKGITNP